jgi:hypothetical protein
MKIKQITTSYIVTKIKEHKKIKKELLFLINKIPKNNYESISHTDWNLPREYKREYLEYFYKIINPYMMKMTDLLNEQRWKISNGWFQQYYKKDTHIWHRHQEANFTNVYYLELPKNNLVTKIKPKLNSEKIYSLEAVEGDVVTFPACIPHTSEKITTNLRKTIISFNSDFY